MAFVSSQAPPLVSAELRLLQLYDVGYGIDLERAREALTVPSSRARPVVSRGGSIEIAELPLDVALGACKIGLAGEDMTGQIYARIYDLGILAIRIALPLPGPMAWAEVSEIMARAQSAAPGVAAIFTRTRDQLCVALAPAIERPEAIIRSEDYTILLVDRLEAGVPASQLGGDRALLQAVLGERRPLSASAQSLATALSYYEDDLILLSWAAALVIEPEADAREDAALLLEFANAQLLAFRSYDAQVEHDLSELAQRMAGPHPAIDIRLFSSTRFLHEIVSLATEITQTSARVENALKVSEDVYWNRVYSAALATLRVEVWRRGIAEALEALRLTASFWHDEALAAWATLLEALVVTLIVLEVVLAIVGLRSGAH